MKKRKYTPRFTIASLYELKEAVEEYFKVDITTNTRKKEIALPRQIYMCLAAVLTTESLRKISGSVNRKHCSALYALKQLYNGSIPANYVSGYEKILHRFRTDTEAALLNMQFEDFLSFKKEARELLSESKLLKENLNTEYKKIKGLNEGENESFSKIKLIASKLDEPTLKKLLETRIEPFILMVEKTRKNV